MVSLRIPRPLKIIAIVYLSYLALMTLIAMPLLNVMAPKIYREQTGRELHLQKIILLNPFTLAVTVRDATSDNADGSRFWAIDRLCANLSLASLWQRHLVLDALQLQGLYVQVEQTAADRYNFNDILDFRVALAAKNPKPAQPAATNSKPFAITINKFEFSAKHLGLRAAYANEPLATNIDDLQLTLNAVTTVPQKSDSPNASFTLHSEAFNADIKNMAIEFLREQQPLPTKLHDLHIKLDEFSTAATESQRFTLVLRDGGEGMLKINGDVSIANKTSSGNVQLHKLDLLPAWHYLADKFAFDAQSAALDADLKYAVGWNGPLHYRVSDGRVNLNNVQLQSRADADTNVRFDALRIDGIQVDSSQPRVQIAAVNLDKPAISGWNRDTQVSLLDMFAFAKNDEPSTSPPWQIQIDDIAANNGDIRWRASQIDNLPLQIAPLEFHATNLHWPDAAPLHVELKSSINNDSQLAVNGDIVPGALSGKLNATLSAIPVTWGNPLLKQQMQATLAGGRFSTQTQIVLADGKPTTLQSDGQIDQLELQQLPDQRKLLAWKQLQWRGLALDLAKQRMQLQKITIAEPWVQFRINEGGTNNFQQLMRTGSAQTTAVATTTKKTEKVSTPTQSTTPWQFAIDTIHVDKAAIDFRDNSLSRQFHTTITELTGNIDRLGNRSKQPAKIAMKGSVDGYAPVALTGTANPFATPPALNVALDITNLDLATLTPYSGTYAGYLIDSGRLSVQLVYTLENKLIKGTNHIVVNELKLGEQVSGPKVKDLPLRFAIYLLTDANGVMDLGVDVTGSVDDPDFSVGNIIWKAFRNLIFKTASSPFRALASLVGGSEQDELDRVEFAAGSDRITENNNDKLTKLVAALQKKPALSLGVTGHVSPNQDLEALRDVTLSRELIAIDGINDKDIQSQSSNWQRAVTKLFKKRYPQQDAGALQPMQMNDWMRDNVELHSSALQELASSRALAVKQLLVTQFGLEANRATVKPVDLGADDKPGRQVTMEVN